MTNPKRSEIWLVDRKLGQVSSETLEELLSGLIICVDYEAAP